MTIPRIVWPLPIALRARASTAAVVIAFVVAACATGGTSGSTPAAATVDVGGTWTAIEVAGLVPDPLSAPRIQFTDGGRLQGITGCNDFSGEVRLDGNRIAIGSIEHKDLGCAAEVRKVEGAFIGALLAADRISGGRGTGRLVISGPGGEIVFTQPRQ